MEERNCVACGEDCTEGFAMGNLCYYCIEETVIDFIKTKKEKE